MNLLRGLAAILDRGAPHQRAGSTYYDRWFPLPALMGELECTPLGVPAFKAGVDLKASMVASLPPYVLDRGRRRDNVPQILYQPDPTEPRLTTLHKMVQSTVYHGEIVAPITAYDELGFPRALTVVDPTMANLTPDGRTWTIGNLTFDRSEVMHLVRFPVASYQRGIGSIELSREFFAGVAAQERFQRDFYLAGGVPSVMVGLDPGASADDVAEAKRSWHEKLSRREPLFVPAGIKAETFQLSNADQQYLESKGFTTIEISNIVGLPASYIGAPNVSQVYANINDNRRELVDVWLRMDLALIEWGFTSLLPDGQQAKLDTDVIVTDPSQRLDIDIKRKEIETLDEIRASRGLPPIPGGDVLGIAYSPPGVSATAAPDRPTVAPALTVVPPGGAA